MTTHVRIIAMIGALVFWSWLAVASDDTQSSTGKKEAMTMTNQYHLILKRLDAVKVSHDMDAFAQIGKDIERLPLAEETDLPERQKMRRQKLELWLKLLNECDQLIDQQFDPNDVPQINIAPPPNTGLSAGASPIAIKDPQLRQEYERAIRLNAEKAERYHIQEKLRDYDKDWSAKANAYMKTQYTSNAQDVAEINALIDRNVANKYRKEQLKKQFGDPR